MWSRIATSFMRATTRPPGSISRAAPTTLGGRTTLRPVPSSHVRTSGNILWLVLAGWWLALGHLVTGIALCLTVIGIPLGVANFKLVPLSLVPFGKTVISIDRIAGRDVWLRGPEPIG